MQIALQQKIDQSDDYRRMMSDVPEYELAYNITNMALTIIKQAILDYPNNDPKKNHYDDNVHHAALVVIRCLTEHPDIITVLGSSVDEVSSFLEKIFQRRHHLAIPEFYFRDRIRRRKGIRPPALNLFGQNLLSLVRGLTGQCVFFKQLHKCLRHIHRVWKRASKAKKQEIYDLDGNLSHYYYQFEEYFASGRTAYLYSGGTVDNDPVLVKKIRNDDEDNFMVEWEAIDILHHNHLLEYRFFPKIYGVCPDQKSFFIKEYHRLEGFKSEDRKIIECSYRDDILERYVQDIYHMTSLFLDHNIRHNDMHISNLVCDVHGNLKLVDFGMLTQISDAEHQYFGLMDYKRQYILNEKEMHASKRPTYPFATFIDKIENAYAILNNPAFLIKKILAVCDKKNQAALDICESIVAQEKKLYTIHMALSCYKSGEDIKIHKTHYDRDYDRRIIYDIIQNKNNGWQNLLLDMASDIASDILEEWCVLEDVI